MDGEEEDLQGATASALLLGFGSGGGVGIGLDATRDDREEMGGAIAAGGLDLDYPQTVAARRAGSGCYTATPRRNSSRGGSMVGGLWMFEPATAHFGLRAGGLPGPAASFGPERHTRHAPSAGSRPIGAGRRIRCDTCSPEPNVYRRRAGPRGGCGCIQERTWQRAKWDATCPCRSARLRQRGAPAGRVSARVQASEENGRRDAWRAEAAVQLKDSLCNR